MPTDSGERCLIMHENGQIIPITEPTRIYHNGTVEVVEPATVLVAENGEKLTVVGKQFVGGVPYVEVTQ